MLQRFFNFNDIILLANIVWITEAPGLDILLLHDSSDSEKIEADTEEFKAIIEDLGTVYEISAQNDKAEQLAA